MARPAPQISAGRKALYYIGMAVAVIGLCLFGYTFVKFFQGMGSDPMAAGDSFPGAFKYAFIGIGCLIVGGIINRIGTMGVAGSGLVLDPERARRDVAPMADAMGGVAADALGSLRDNLAEHRPDQPTALPAQNATTPAVMVRCQACHELNPETSSFCGKCGQRL